MSQLLILGSSVLAVGPLVETSAEIAAPDVIFPKQSMPGWQIVETNLPNDFSPMTHEWANGSIQKKSIEAD